MKREGVCEVYSASGKEKGTDPVSQTKVAWNQHPYVSYISSLE